MVQLDGINLKRVRIRGKKRRRKDWKAAMGHKEKMLSLRALRSMRRDRRQPSLERAEGTALLQDIQVETKPGDRELSHEHLQLP